VSCWNPSSAIVVSGCICYVSRLLLFVYILVFSFLCFATKQLRQSCCLWSYDESFWCIKCFCRRLKIYYNRKGSTSCIMPLWNSSTLSPAAVSTLVDATLSYWCKIYSTKLRNLIFHEKERDIFNRKHGSLILIAIKREDAKRFQFLLRSQRCSVVKVLHIHADVAI